MVVRRKVLPYVAHTIWDGIRRITHQRHLANITRLLRLLQKERPELSTPKAEQYITDCIDEGIIVPAPKGFGPQSYVLPNPSDITRSDGSHDWYCIECHWPGDVEMCQTCHRVFHLECKKKAKSNKTDITPTKLTATSPSRKSNTYNDEIPDLNSSNSNSKLDSSQSGHDEEDTEKVKNEKSNTLSKHSRESTSIPNLKHNGRDSTDEIDADLQHDEDRICSICKMVNADNFEIDTEELNYLMGFIFARIKNWLPPNITDGIGAPDPEPWAVESDRQWRACYLLYEPIDVKAMELKARTKSYKKLSEIHADILSIKHNVAIYHGRHSTEVQAVDYMLVDACHDIDEIRQCVDCYHNSNEKKTRRWFCIPCTPPHELVWAKQKGFSYWPAKVIKRLERQYDVRFFGAKYLRAVIDHKSVKPINIPLMNLKIKRSPAFNKAYEELQLHQEWIRKPSEMAKYLSVKTSKNNSSEKKPPRESLDDTPKSSNISKKRTSTSKDSVSKKRKSTTSPTMSVENIPPVRELRSKSLVSKPNLSVDGTSSSIVISDAEDDEIIQSQDDLISSTQDIRYQINNSDVGSSPDNNPPKLSDNKNVEAAENLKRQLEGCNERQQIIQLACDAVQEQVDRFTEKIRGMAASQTAIISNIKKKQWCYNCEQEAIYHCCWNTSYCSTECQQMHWHAEHKRNCRRKRT